MAQARLAAVKAKARLMLMAAHSRESPHRDPSVAAAQDEVEKIKTRKAMPADTEEFTLIVGGVIASLAVALFFFGVISDPIQTTAKGGAFF